MKATVLVDNHSSGNLSGEWGLSVYIEYNGKKILLDTGASNLYAVNAEKLGLSVRNVDYAVLSHAHYDHGNGMPDFFKRNTNAVFYLCQSCGENCYRRRLLRDKYIGLPCGVLDAFATRIQSVSGVLCMDDGVFLVPHSTPGLSSVGKREKMVIKNPNETHPDDFSHEQSLVFKTEKGLVVFNSCSHAGADVIVREVQAVFPDEKVFAIIGGFHLFNKSKHEIIRFAQHLSATDVEYICTGHCTGDKAYNILQGVLGQKLHKLHTGLVIEF